MNDLRDDEPTLKTLDPAALDPVDNANPPDYSVPSSLSKPFLAQPVTISGRLKSVSDLDYSVMEGLLRLGAAALSEGKEHFTIGAKVKSPEGARKPFTLQIFTVLIEKRDQGYYMK